MPYKIFIRINCLFLLIVLYLTTASAVFANLEKQSINSSIKKLENGIVQASELYDTGKLPDAPPFQVRISSNITVSFSRTSFTTDLSLAFDHYKKLLIIKYTSVNQQANLQPPATAEARPSNPPAKKNIEADDEITALMRAEQETVSAQPRSQSNNFNAATGFDVYSNYQMSHAATLQQADQMAEFDMQNVLAERQAAETERLQKIQRDQEIQGQAMEWQSLLDKQASDSARKAAEWEATHSFGAYATSFLGTIAQTAIGSFTGGLLTPVATILANKTVKSLFNIDPKAIDTYNQKSNNE